MKKLLVPLLVLLPGTLVLAKPVSSVKEIRTVYDGGSQGNAYFNSRLRSQMRGMGIRFVKSRTGADAILRSNGNWTNAGGFSGSASLTTPQGKTLWRASTKRAPRSRAMAFDSLAAKLRAARR